MSLSFAPIFNSLLDSSIWEEPYHVRLLWITMLTLKGPDQVVRGYNAYKLARRANITPQEAQEGLDVLSNPDKRCPEQSFDGRRIELIARDCWKILNGGEFQTQMAQVLRRNYQARWQKERRQRVREQSETYKTDK